MTSLDIFQYMNSLHNKQVNLSANCPFTLTQSLRNENNTNHHMRKVDYLVVSLGFRFFCLLHTAYTFYYFSLFHSVVKTYLFRKSYPPP